MLKKTLYLLIQASFIFADMDLYSRPDQKISVQNQILAKVNGNVISVMDVMKKMDMVLHQNYPQHAESVPARFQFYTSSWRSVFMEMVDMELILADAKDKEIKLTDGDVREEIENRFGPNVLQTLDGLRLSYDDAWKMIKNDLLMQRMVWFFVQSKAMQKVNPGAIRQSYQHYLEKNPPYNEMTYRVISVNGDALEVLRLAREGGLDALKELQGVQVSNEYSAKEQDLSSLHRDALASLDPGFYSEPVSSVGRDGKTVTRIFFLADKVPHLAPSFEELAPKLKNELMQKAMAKESESYLGRLRKHYGFDSDRLRETVPSDLQPFSLL
jgi:hypothetical protein